MANDICNHLDKMDGKEKRICDSGCKNFRFPHLERACVLSEVYSVKKGEGCYIYEQEKMKNIIKELGITEGSWGISGADNQFVTGGEGRTKDSIIGEVWGISKINLPERIPNTKLISASPDMLKALIRIFYSNKDHERPCGDECDAPNGCDCYVNQSILAIEKGTGKNQLQIKELLNENN